MKAPFEQNFYYSNIEFSFQFQQTFGKEQRVIKINLQGIINEKFDAYSLTYLINQLSNSNLVISIDWHNATVISNAASNIITHFFERIHPQNFPFLFSIPSILLIESLNNDLILNFIKKIKSIEEQIYCIVCKNENRIKILMNELLEKKSSGFFSKVICDNCGYENIVEAVESEFLSSFLRKFGNLEHESRNFN